MPPEGAPRIRTSHIVFGVVALFLVLLGAWFLIGRNGGSDYQSQTNSKPSGNPVVATALNSSDPYDVLIAYTDDGYVPREVTIKPGQRVRFVNESDNETWPASAIHPTHSIYPQKNDTDCLGSEFDSCLPVKNGDFFAYTFHYTGDWSYHDHLRAFHSGVIHVVE